MSEDEFFSGFVAIGPIGPWAVAMGLTDFPDFGDFDYVQRRNLTPHSSNRAVPGGGLVPPPSNRSGAARRSPKRVGPVSNCRECRPG